MEQSIQPCDLRKVFVNTSLYNPRTPTLAEIVRQALDLNRSGDYRAARRFAKQQLGYFRHYTRRLDEGRELFGKLQMALDRMVRPMREHSRKEIASAMYKRNRGERDQRVMQAPAEWESYLEE